MGTSAAGVRAELIYDAIIDDECLKALPAAFEAAYGARSCTLHWRHHDGGAEVLSHSGYFSDEHMLDYAENFASSDLWTLRAIERSRINQVWNCDELVPHEAYEKSVFYNEWIRAMGDDTYFCMGTVMETKWGQGIIGLHRGKAQFTFEKDRLVALTKDVVHLRRMLVIRGRLAKAERQTRGSMALLDSIGDAVMAVTPDGCLIHSNNSAEKILKRNDGLSVRAGSLVACSPAANSKLKAALARASDPEEPRATAVAVPRADGGRYDLSLATVRFSDTSRHVMITIVDPDARDNSVEHRLSDLYGLTAAEAYIARRFSEGATLKDIAGEREVALGTVRTQVKAVAAKLNCSRQAEVVQVVSALPRLAEKHQ